MKKATKEIAKTQFEIAQEQVKAGKLTTPTVGTSEGDVDYFGYQLAVHKYQVSLMSKGIKPTRHWSLKPIKEYYGLQGKSAKDCLTQLLDIIAKYDESLKAIHYVSAPASTKEWVALAKKQSAMIKDNQSLRLCSAKASYYVFRIDGKLYIGTMQDGSEECSLKPLFSKKDTFNLGPDMDEPIAVIQELA